MLNKRWVSDVAQGLASLLYPRACTGCSLSLPGWGCFPLCPDCLRKIPRLLPPWCIPCGRSLHSEGAGYAEGAGFSSCVECRGQIPFFDQVISPFGYEGIARRLVMELKYRGRLSLAAFLGDWMAQAVKTRLKADPAPGLTHPAFLPTSALADSLAPAKGLAPADALAPTDARAGTLDQGDALLPIDAIVPVPLYPTRLRERTFNQAQVLAQALSGKLHLPVMAHGLIRIRPTPPQATLSGRARRANVKGAFALRPDLKGRLKPFLRGKRLLLVDDVFTTGATANACAQVLKTAGATKVIVATVAHG